MTSPIVAFKAFDKNFRCRGYQYEVGKTYTHEESGTFCESGFHACENPWDVLDHSPITCRFAEVELGGQIAREGANKKLMASQITVKREIGFGDFVKALVQSVATQEAPKIELNTPAVVEAGRAGSARIASNAKGARIASGGDRAQISSSGDGARVGSSGHRARIASSGYGTQIGSSGDGARIGSSGYGARIGASGKNSVVAAAGCDTAFRLGPGGSAAIAYQDETGRIRFALAYVGENIEANTWYRVDKTGTFVRVES